MIGTDESNDGFSPVVRYALNELGPFGVTTEDASRLKNSLLEQLGHAPTNFDLAWALYEACRSDLSSPNDLAEVSFAAARFLHSEGRDHRATVREAFRAQISGYANMGVVRGIIVRAQPGCCESCAAHHGLEVTLQEAMTNPPLPCPHCACFECLEDKFPWCRCELEVVLGDR